MRRYLILIAMCCVCLDGAAAQTGATDWSGFYLGGSVGATRSKVETGTTVTSAAGYFVGADPAQIASAGDGSLREWQPSGAIHAGYAWQFGSFLLGIEADAGTLLFDEDRSTTQTFLSSPTDSFTLRQSAKADWMASLRPRLGFAAESWLAYVTGGIAVTRLKMENTYTDTSSFNGSSHSRSEKFRFGWSLGVGAAYALGSNWALRGEYLYSDFGTMHASSAVTESFGGTPVLRHAADLQTHAIRVGIDYRF